MPDGVANDDSDDISLGPGGSSRMTIKVRNEKKIFIFEASRVRRTVPVYFSHKVYT